MSCQLFSGSTRLPAVDRGQSSDHDVYMGRYVGSKNGINSARWFRVLYFKTTTPSVAGIYTCAANYIQEYCNQSVEILVSRERKVHWHE